MEILRHFVKQHYNFITSFIYSTAMILFSSALYIATNEIIAFIFLFIVIFEITYLLCKIIKLDE